MGDGGIVHVLVLEGQWRRQQGAVGFPAATLGLMPEQRSSLMAMLP
jgi:hypothetical protein